MVIQADWQDADYVYAHKEITKETYLDIYKFFYENKLTLPLNLKDLDGSILNQLQSIGLPGAPDSYNIHTIESITFYKIEEKITL